jgi:hypothetical protein
MNRILEDALAYAARGWHVFPCHHGTKRPVYLGSWKLATTNPATIRRIFGSSTEYNIAIRCCGPESRLVVLDEDERNDGPASLTILERRNSPLPPTLRCRTANGRHRYFYTDVLFEPCTGRVGPGLDVPRYVIAPPSVHPDGPIYTWENDEPLAPAPDWLIKLTRKPPPPPIPPPPGGRRPSPAGSGSGAYGAAALRRECEMLASMPPNSGRNNALNRASFCLHQLVAGGELDGATVEHRLLGAAEANGLTSEDGLRQVLATIASGRRAGLAHPRSRR